MALGHGKLVDRDRNGMGRGNPVEAAKTADLDTCHGIAIERLKAVIEKRQLLFGAWLAMGSTPGMGRAGPGIAPPAGLRKLRARL